MYTWKQNPAAYSRVCQYQPFSLEPKAIPRFFSNSSVSKHRDLPQLYLLDKEAPALEGNSWRNVADLSIWEHISYSAVSDVDCASESPGWRLRLEYVLAVFSVFQLPRTASDWDAVICCAVNNWIWILFTDEVFWIIGFLVVAELGFFWFFFFFRKCLKPSLFSQYLLFCLVLLHAHCAEDQGCLPLHPAQELGRSLWQCGHASIPSHAHIHPCTVSAASALTLPAYSRLSQLLWAFLNTHSIQQHLNIALSAFKQYICL